MTQISIKQIKQQQLIDFINNTINISLNEGQIKDIVDQLNTVIAGEIDRLNNKIDTEVENLNKKISVSTLTRINFFPTPATRIYPLPPDIDLDKLCFFILNGMYLWEGSDKDYTINTETKSVHLNFNVHMSDHFGIEYYKKIS
jgi:hypothetical protein